MDDLSHAFNELLSNPDTMRQLQQAAESLGLAGSGGPGPAGAAGPPPAPRNPGSSGSSSGWTTGSVGRNIKHGRNVTGAQTRTREPSRDDDLVAIRSMLEQLLAQQTAARPDPVPAPPAPPADSFDLSGLSELLGSLGGAGKSGGSAGSGLNLSALSDILGNLGSPGGDSGKPLPDLSGLNGLLSSLGGAAGPPGSPGGAGLSALSGLLGGGGNPGGGPDLSGLSGILGNLSGGGAADAAAPSSVSTLTSMLGGGNQPAPGLPGGGGGFDLNMLGRFQQAMSSMNTSAGNVRLLLALKGHLRDGDRVAKVDDAIRVMQVVQFLPLLKESGLFGKLEEILDGFHLGGIGDMLGGLTGRR